MFMVRSHQVNLNSELYMKVWAAVNNHYR